MRLRPRILHFIVPDRYATLHPFLYFYLFTSKVDAGLVSHDLVIGRVSVEASGFTTLLIGGEGGTIACLRYIIIIRGFAGASVRILTDHSVASSVGESTGIDPQIARFQRH